MKKDEAKVDFSVKPVYDSNMRTLYFYQWRFPSGVTVGKISPLFNKRLVNSPFYALNILTDKTKRLSIEEAWNRFLNNGGWNGHR